MKRFRFIGYRFYLILLFGGASLLAEEPVLTQWSTIDSILKGHYYGVVTLQEASRYGDFAIGTLEHLNGELLALDQKFYQIDAEGNVHPLSGEEQTPFLAITHFQNDLEFEVPEGLSLLELQEWLDARLPTENYFYAIRMEGTFTSIRTRSVPPQDLPYPPLVEVTKNQSVFDYVFSQGTIVGFRCPPYAKTLNVPGYHLHYLAKDLSGGGHVLGFSTGENMRVRIGIIKTFSLHLPGNTYFRQLDLSGNNLKDLHKAEQERAE